MIDPEGPVADVVLAHSGTASVLDRYHIDYCCRGHEPLARACEGRGVAVAALIVELDAVCAQPDENADPRTAPTSALVSRVLAQQHRYLRGALAAVSAAADDIAREHASRLPVTRVIAKNVDELARRMLAHLDHEEDVLFPAVLRGDRDVVQPELAHMFDEHREFGDHFVRLRATTGDYRAPDDEPDLADLYRALAELEGMVGRHHHVENHVLLPRFQ